MAVVAAKPFSGVRGAVYDCPSEQRQTLRRDAGMPFR